MSKVKKKKLIETLAVQIAVPAPNYSISLDNMLTSWGSVPYGELSLILTSARYLSMVHQTHHWISAGESSYSDHLLFMRLYESLNDEIDSLAEKSIGLGSVTSVDLCMQIAQIMQLSNSYNDGFTHTSSSKLVSKSYAAEVNFLRCIAHCVESLKQKNMLTRGLDNLLAGIEDKHEENCYLLKQRMEIQS